MALYRKLHELLLKADLSETEALIYLELLKKPVASVFNLAKQTGLSKTSVYRAFERLKSLKMAEKNTDGIRALSLKTLVSSLIVSKRRLDKTAYNLKLIAPFLRTPSEAIEEFETFYTQDQIAETYVGLADSDFDVSLDFGDFENFVPMVGGIEMPIKFRRARMKHAVNYAICTSSGPHTALFCTKEAKEKFKNTVNILKLNFSGNFICFFDRNNYVLYNNFSDPENPSSVLVKSKIIADSQRFQYQEFSRILGKC